MSAPSLLIDTDCVIDHFNAIQAASARVRKAIVAGLGLSVISLAELWEGIYFSRNPTEDAAQLREFVSSVSVIGISEETCQIFGRLRGTLRPQGKSIPNFDLIIAATALEHNLTLLSNNRRHFESVPEQIGRAHV